MALFLRERAPKDARELTRLAEQYMEAHGGNIGKSSKATYNSSKPNHQVRNNNPQQQKANDKTTEVKGQRTRLCFICGGEGHIARDHSDGGKIGSRPNKGGQSKDTNKAALCKSTQKDRVVTDDCIRSEIHSKKDSSTAIMGRIRLEDRDVTRYCRSCDICQKTTPKGRVTKVPLGEMPLIEEPFQRVAVYLIGPIYPASETKNRYILTVVDYATRYPEATALPKIETERIAEALMEIFCRVGFPKEILSNRGTQFTSGLMEEVCRLVSVKQLFTTPYNPKCNGWCERMNGVLKSMLKKMCQERPKDWDRYIPAVLFSYREVPQASTGFSSFELLYGRTVRGPMQALKGIWTDEANEKSETRNTYQYVLNLRDRLEETCKIAREFTSITRIAQTSLRQES